MNYIPSYKDHDCTEEEFDASKSKKPKKSKMTFNLSEETLLFLLKCAVNSADFDESEKGFSDSARKTREMIFSIVSEMNHKIGYEKYRYSSEYGLLELDEPKEAETSEDEPMPIADKCPGCGKEPRLIHPAFDGGTYVECPTIGCIGYGDQTRTWAETDRKAIGRWNEFVKKVRNQHEREN